METVISKLMPVFILAVMGFIAGKCRILPAKVSDGLCSFLFYFSAPAVSFANIMNSDIETIFNTPFVLSLIVFELSILLLLFFVYKTVFKFDPQESVIHSLCSFYGNISYVGIPVFLTLFNDVIPNIITILIHMILTFPLVIFLLDWFTGAGSGGSALHALKSAVKNPNVFMPVIGAVLLALKIQLPQVILDTADLLGKPTTAVGMFALGMTCSESGREITSPKVLLHAFLSSVLKLVVCPFYAWLIGKYIFALDSWWLTSLVIIAMLPAALNDYILSQRYHTDEAYAGLAVLMSNLLFSITISLYILLVGL